MAARVRIELVDKLKDGADHVDALASRATVTADGVTVTAESGAAATTSDFYPIAAVRTIRYYTGEINPLENMRRDDPVPEV